MNDKRAALIVELLDKCKLVCLNNKQATRISSTGTPSHLDLACVSDTIAPKTTFEVCDDNYSCDHLPLKVIIRSGTPIYSQRRKDTYFDKNWDRIMFNKLLQPHLNNLNEKDLSIENKLKMLNSLLIDTSKAITSTEQPKNNTKRYSVPYWNSECKSAIKNERKCFKKLRNNKTLSNAILYKVAKAKTKYVIKMAKQSYWENYCNQINGHTKLSNLWRFLKAMKKNVPRPYI